MIRDVVSLSRYLCMIGMGGLKGIPQDWVFPKVTLIFDIMVFHMGSQRQQVPALKLLQTRNFNHITRGLTAGSGDRNQLLRP